MSSATTKCAARLAKHDSSQSTAYASAVATQFSVRIFALEDLFGAVDRKHIVEVILTMDFATIPLPKVTQLVTGLVPKLTSTVAYVSMRVTILVFTDLAPLNASTTNMY